MFGNYSKYPNVVVADNKRSDFVDVQLVDDVIERKVRPYDGNERALPFKQSPHTHLGTFQVGNTVMASACMLCQSSPHFDPSRLRFLRLRQD